MPVETGYIPDWAKTNLENPESHQYNVKEKESSEGIMKLDNAESSITLEPQITDPNPSETYNTREETKEIKKSTGKFFKENNSGEKESDSTAHRKQWKNSTQNSENLESLHSIQITIKENSQELKIEDLNQQQETSLGFPADSSSNEIENILMMEKNKESKPQTRGKWDKGKKKPITKIGTHNDEDSNPIEYHKIMKNLKEGAISKDDLPKNFYGKLDMIAQTPKPNLKYPIPQMESGFGETSFGAQAKQVQQLRGIKEEDVANKEMEKIINGTPEKEDDVSMNINDVSDIRIPTENKGTDSKIPLKSRIPGIKKASPSVEWKEGENKQIRSFVEENKDELQPVPVPYPQPDENSCGESPQKNKFTSHKFLEVHQLLEKGKNENCSMNNNDNISNQPHVKSEGVSEKDEFSQKEDSVHMEGNNIQDIKSETYNYPNIESVGDTELYKLHNDSTLPQKADELTNAAVNSSLKVELDKINESLLKIVNITGRKEMKGVDIRPEIEEGVNNSLNLILSVVTNMKHQSKNGFEGNIKF